MREGEHATGQTTLRWTVALLLLLLVVAEDFGLDVVLGAFLARVVLRRWAPGDVHALEEKLDAVGYGFFIPVFFVASGMGLDLRSIVEAPGRLILFFVLLLAVRGLPTLLLVYRLFNFKAGTVGFLADNRRVRRRAPGADPDTASPAADRRAPGSRTPLPKSAPQQRSQHEQADVAGAAQQRGRVQRTGRRIRSRRPALGADRAREPTSSRRVIPDAPVWQQGVGLLSAPRCPRPGSCRQREGDRGVRQIRNRSSLSISPRLAPKTSCGGRRTAKSPPSR
jgi:hypothetical protein